MRGLKRSLRIQQIRNVHLELGGFQSKTYVTFDLYVTLKRDLRYNQRGQEIVF